MKCLFSSFSLLTLKTPLGKSKLFIHNWIAVLYMPTICIILPGRSVMLNYQYKEEFGLTFVQKTQDIKTNQMVCDSKKRSLMMVLV